MRGYRRGFTIRDLVVTISCLFVAAGMLVSLTGATRNLSQSQVCANNLRQLFAGVVAYVSQYNAYPPHAPYPTYMASETINGISTGGWDPNIGFIMTHGLGLQPPARDSVTGHFKWYGTNWDSMPEVCKCPALPAAMLDPANPEVADPAHNGEGAPLETVLYQYTLSYQTSGTCRAACPVVRAPVFNGPGDGGRNWPIPDPGRGQQWNNTQRGSPPGVWAAPKSGDPSAFNENDFGNESRCYIQAVNPSEVQSPGRTYYLADSRDYRPEPKGNPYDSPPAGYNDGSVSGWGNRLFLGTRHFGYANVLYLDGRVTRDNQIHIPVWNMVYNPNGLPPQSNQWRMGTFATNIVPADLRGQVPIMPVLMVRSWEYFFDANGFAAR